MAIYKLKLDKVFYKNCNSNIVLYVYILYENDIYNDNSSKNDPTYISPIP